jgi:hypothetical protein
MKKSLSFLLSMLFASAALAEPPPAQRASALVQKELLQPLKKSESRRKSFSRAAPVPKERRIRILDQAALTDARGRHFVRFAIDARYRGGEPGEWYEDTYVGCAYLDEKKVFIQRGDAYYPAQNALDGEGEAQAGMCEAAQGAIAVDSAGAQAPVRS